MKLKIEYEHPIAVNAFTWTPFTYKQALHVHASLEVGCCISGTGSFHFGDKQYPVQPGDIFIVNNLEPHIAVSDAEDPSSYIFVYFDPGILLQEDETLLLPFSYSPEGFDNRFAAGSEEAASLSRLSVSIYEELQTKRPGYRSLVKSRIVEMCVLLLRACSGTMSQPEWKRRTGSFHTLRAVLGYLEAHFREPIGLDDLAEFLGLTPATASRYFQELAGRHFSEVLQELRIGDAKRLLIGTDRTITDICFESGFQSVSAFYRLFKKAAGCSPLAYREQYSASAIMGNAVQ